MASSFAEFPSVSFHRSPADRTEWVYDAGSGLLLQKKNNAELGPVYTYHPSGLPASRAWARGVAASYLVSVPP